jgi:2-amino-4-hydroxy-6-hydroxymethyldihydropteridine diphosphokinase
MVDVEDDSAWVSAFVGSLSIDQAGSDRNIPRLIARMQWTRPEQRWPAPHNIWPSTSRWPEYRLEVDDLDWAAGEVASALDSMRCPIKPITEDGNWWC